MRRLATNLPRSLVYLDIKRDMVETTTLAYLAGIIDGEGCIGIYGYREHWANGRTFRIDVRVGMGEPHAVVLLRQTFGGSICSRKNLPKGATKPSYQWNVSNKLAVACLKLLVPFLRVKKAQADLVLEFAKTRAEMGHKYGKLPYTEQEFTKLAEYGDLLRETKREVIPLHAVVN